MALATREEVEVGSSPASHVLVTTMRREGIEQATAGTAEGWQRSYITQLVVWNRRHKPPPSILGRGSPGLFGPRSFIRARCHRRRAIDNNTDISRFLSTGILTVPSVQQVTYTIPWGARKRGAAAFSEETAFESFSESSYSLQFSPLSYPRLLW